VFDLVEAVADSKATVLITGQSGTGKSLIARAIHHRSNRRDAPFRNSVRYWLNQIF
jgi:DNA-binding NtrC family response regulator